MAWVVPTLYAGVRAYNTYKQVEELDATFNSGRGKKWLKAKLQRAANRRQRMPRAFGVLAKRRRFDDAGGGDAVGVSGAYTNDVHYRRKRTLGKVNIRKLAKQGTAALYDRWQKMGVYSNLNGQLWLEKNGAVNAANGDLIALRSSMPMYMWDLTACRNLIGGIENVPYAAWQIVKDATTGGYWPNHIAGQNIATGGNATNLGTMSYQWYQTPRTASLDAPIDTGILDWVKVQAVVYGSKKQSHKVFFDVVQLDPIVCPKAEQNIAGTGLPIGTGVFNTDELGGTNDTNVWYTNKMNYLVDGPFSSVFPQGASRRIKERILDRKVLEFSPVAAFEENGAGLVHKKTLNMFVKMGRNCKFDWRVGTPDLANLAAGDGEIETKVERGDHDTYVHPHARVYLRVYSTTYTGSGVNGFTKEEVTPSFDIRISRKWLVSS